MRTDFQNVLVEQDESVVTLTMNRPDVLNAINTLMLEELTEAAYATADHRESVDAFLHKRAVKFTGK